MVDEILEAIWKSEPVDATFTGIHIYDHLLSKVDKQSRLTRINEIQKHLEMLNAYSESQLDEMAIVDRRILIDFLETSLFNFNKIKHHNRLTSIYTSEISFGIYILQMRDFAPLQTRAENLLSRLRAIPDYLRNAQMNLEEGTNIPKLWTETGIMELENCIYYFQSDIPPFATSVKSLETEIRQANEEALEALKSFLLFLKNSLLAKSTGDYAIGKFAFDFYLKKKHGLNLQTDDLLKIGKGILKQTKEELTKVSKKIDPNLDDWTVAVKLAKKDHPEDDLLIQTYKEFMQKAKQFIIREKLVTIPDGENLEVVETPVFQRATLPYAAYISPAPFDKQQTGIFWVTPIDPNKSPADQEAQRQDHTIHGIPITALHEAYPGHHLQLVHSNGVPSKVRKQFGTSVFSEGWALYCEEMMFEKGFLQDHRSRLLQLKDQLWRACRVIIDVKIHTNEMSFDEAVAMLVDEAKLERTNAITEVRRYVQTPTQPMSYIIGKVEIQKLRDQYKQRMGDKFNLLQFHNELLSYGTIPISLVAEKMLQSLG